MPSLRLLSVALLSASLLSYEIALLRVFSIALWHHFAYLILSIAMLGFGASGTALSLVQPHPRHLERWFVPLAWATALAEVGGLALALKVPFEPFLLAWDFTQGTRLLAFYVLLGFPFLLGASAIALVLLTRERVREVYFADLCGAGVGALIISFILYYMDPSRAIGLVAALASTSAVVAAKRRSWKVLAAATTVTIPIAGYSLLEQNTSPYKGLSTTLTTPEASVVAHATSPLSVLHAVSSPTIRYAPGLSLNFVGEIPEQIAIFADGDQLGVMTHAGSNLDFLGHMTTALPYHMVPQNFSALVLGSGGGMEVLSALHHGAGQVVAVEMNPQVVRLVDDVFSDFSGGLYSDERVRVKLAEARRYVETTTERFDLISVSLLDSFLSSASGVHAASESYLYTVEALAACRDRLKPGGLLAITRRIKTPPREVLRMFNTLVEVTHETSIETSGGHLAGIRSWSTATLLLKNTSFTREDIESIRTFSEDRSFDIIWYPGFLQSEANRYHILSRPYYAEAAGSLLSNERKSFVRTYPFRIDPTTDDRPYFFHFFRWRTLPSFIQELGLSWIPFVEWGYLILLAVVVQAILVSTSLILAPFIITPTMRRSSPFGRLRVATYFGCLGLGYLFIEIAFIQKFALFLSHPILAATTVLASMLFFSGLGSLMLAKHHVFKVAAAIAGLLLVYPLILPTWFTLLFDQPDFVRVLGSIVVIAPLAFLMGAPFPLGLERLRRQSPQLAPWAWGVNGFGSVLGPPLATLLAMSCGFRVVFITGAALYLLAGIVLAEGHNDH